MINVLTLIFSELNQIIPFKKDADITINIIWMVDAFQIILLFSIYNPIFQEYDVM